MKVLTWDRLLHCVVAKCIECKIAYWRQGQTECVNESCPLHGVNAWPGAEPVGQKHERSCHEGPTRQVAGG